MIITVWNGPFLFFFLPFIFTYNDNPTFTVFVEISRVLIFQNLLLVIFVAATSHLLRIGWKVTARPGNWLLKSATTMLWTWVDRTSSHLQYSECNTGVPPSWSYWWWPPSISRTSEGITAVSAFSLIYVPSLGRSDIWFIWCWLPTLLSIQFSIPSLRVIFKRNYLSCSQGR